MSFILIIVKSTQYISLSYLFKESDDNFVPVEKIKISIIIALKNEEKNVKNLIAALQGQTYPTDLYEVIFVDDNSTDNTFKSLTSYTQIIPHFKVISATDKLLPAKKGALALGVEASQYAYLLLTDGDCVPQKEWISSFAKKFSQGYDLIVGIAPYKQSTGFLNSLICYENLMNAMLTSSFLSLKIPYAAAGRSIAYTKSAYISVKGYHNTMDTISGDDDLFIREAVKKNLNVSFVSSRESLVFSNAQETLSKYLVQRVRHLKTSHYYPFTTQSVLFIWHEITYFSQYFFLLCFISPAAFIVTLLKILIDIILVLIFQRKFGYTFSIMQIVPLSFCYELFVFIHIINSMIKKTKWKE